MPRYVIEREFPQGLQIPADETGAKACVTGTTGEGGELHVWA